MPRAPVGPSCPPAASLSAQSFSVDPPGPSWLGGGGGGAVEVRKTSVQAEIVDGVATTTIRQVLGATATHRELEAGWMLPPPEDNVADGFTMTVGDKERRMRRRPTARGRSTKPISVRQTRDPGLLEFVGDGLLRARVFPIPGPAARWR